MNLCIDYQESNIQYPESSIGRLIEHPVSADGTLEAIYCR